jgi:hypothetical protein
MITKGYIRRAALLICFGTAVSGLNACIITLINDSNGIIRVNNKNDNTSFDLKKNNRRRFGSHHKLSYFEISVPQPKTHSFILRYTCVQKGCGKTGNPQIKFSDLEEGEGVAELFTITKNNIPHTSMVNSLPMIQKKLSYSRSDIN